MAITKEKFISDVILQLTQGSPSDDIQLEDLQVAQWSTVVINDLVTREITSYMKQGKFIPPIYIVRETGKALLEETVTDIDDEKQRIYFALSGEVLDLPNDAGVVQVLDYDLNVIHRGSLERMQIINALRFARPTQDNKVYYRSGTSIFIEGFATADIDFNPIIVDYVKKQDIGALSDSGSILLSDQLYPIALAGVVQMGKTQMYGSSPDQANDGIDTKSIQYHTAIANNQNRVQQTEQQAE